MGSDRADVICYGRLFQTSTAATGKARSPYVESGTANRQCVL